ncbi:plasmid mobilization protein, partial [Escherichia coli]|uniref:plasmid mobilization protein n=1 Tax=Escherichia coli TaxID=562 RepID=UPI00405718B3|nr:hypothetical protein [Escherichia coli]
VRLTAEEDQEIRKRAAECGKTVSGFLRAAALGKKVNSLTDDRGMLWPGYLALVPVVGAMLVLSANRQRSWLTANFFASRLGA